MRTKQNEGMGERALKFSQAVVIIGPMALGVSTSLVVATTMLLVYPRLENDPYTAILALWVLLIPIVAIIVFVAILVLFRLMLWAVSDTPKKAQRKRGRDGRFIPMYARGDTRASKYLVVLDENGDRPGGVGG